MWTRLLPETEHWQARRQPRSSLTALKKSRSLGEGGGVSPPVK
jgi:hypothetical protein